MQALSGIRAYLWPVKKEPETFTEKVNALAEVVKQTPVSTWLNPRKWNTIIEEHPQEVKLFCQIVLVSRIALQIGSDPYGMVIKMGTGAAVGAAVGTIFAEEWVQCAEKLNETWSKTSKGFQVTSGVAASLALIDLSAPTVAAVIAGAVTTRSVTKKQ